MPEPQRTAAPEVVGNQLRAALEGVRPWRLTEKREAKRAALQAADGVGYLRFREAKSAADQQQAELDTGWERLVANDPDVVIPTLEEAFEDNHFPAVPVDIDGDELAVAMLFDSVDRVVPERRPNVTPTGRTTLKKRTKTELNEFYLVVLASQTMAAVREAFAVAPAVSRVLLVVCRDAADRSLECVYIGDFARAEVEDVSGRATIDVFDNSALHLSIGGRTDEIQPLDLGNEPEVEALVEQLAQARQGQTAS